MEQLPYLKGSGRLVIGNRVRLSGKSSIEFMHRVDGMPELVIGDGTFLGHDCGLHIGRWIRIGRNCLFASGVCVYDLDGHPLDACSRRSGEPTPAEAICPVVIEDDVWIGTRAVILKGVTVGSRSVIAAGAVVSKDVPADTVVAGNPARVVKQLVSEALGGEDTERRKRHRPSRSMLNVLITVDTEVYPLLPGWRGENLRRDIQRDIYGETTKGNFGISYQLEVLNRHGIKAVFFIESLFALAVGIEPLAEMVRKITKAGHEVQLHLHPEWLSWMNKPPVPACGRQQIREFSLDEQTELIRIGIANLQAAGACGVSAFRAGDYAANNDTLIALAKWFEMGLEL